MSRVCLLTPGQPSTDPRLVKEADALTEAGHEVQVLCSHYVAWADVSDRELLRTRKWRCTYVGGESDSLEYWITRLRYGITRRCRILWKSRIRDWAVSRVTPELCRAAVRVGADLYIAHYTGALAAAAVAARTNKAVFAFDAEDFESGYYSYEAGPTAMDRLAEDIEREYLPECRHVTAASPGIAEAYSLKYSLPLPIAVLNVFPLAGRTNKFRASNSTGPLRLYWFSQTIGMGRGLEDVLGAMGKLSGCNLELHLRGRLTTEVQRSILTLGHNVGVKADKICIYPPACSDRMVEIASAYDVGLALERNDSQNHNLCLSNKVFTYLAAGNAIAATTTQGQRALMAQVQGAGFVYEPGDVESLADGLHRWYEDRNLLEQARRESWDWGARQYNWDCEREKFLGVVERALNKETCASSAGR